MMKKTAVLLLLLNLPIFANTSGCQLNDTTNFKASYTFQTPQGENQLNYYRAPKQSAFEYKAQGVTEVWHKTANDKAYLIRGFDADKRSIEYEVIDLKMENQNSAWQKKKNIMNPESFDFDKVVIEEKAGCKLAHYAKSDDDREITMVWNQSKDILVDLEVKQKGKVAYHYALSKIETLDKSNNHLAEVLAYDRTDFADIGDNESDPFFRKMINLGFVSHHEVNIINAKGQQVEAEAHHH